MVCRRFTGQLVQPAPIGLSTAIQEPSERLERTDTAGLCPSREFCHIHAAVSRFTVVNPGLWPAHFRAQLALREPGLLPNISEELWQATVACAMLSLRHAGMIRSADADTGCVSP